MVTALHENDPIAKRLKKVFFVVEANSYESMMLWKSNEESDAKRQWKEDNSGDTVTVGEVDGRPVNVTFFYTTIEGRVVAFMNPISQMVDWKMIDDWLELNCKPLYDGGTRIARTNAMNFHNCLHAIDDANKVAVAA